LALVISTHVGQTEKKKKNSSNGCSSPPLSFLGDKLLHNGDEMLGYLVYRPTSFKFGYVH